MKKILFLCTGNSCRSQMAEGWANALSEGEFVFYSAGTQKDGLNPFAVRVMKEVGIDITHQYSKTIEDLKNISMDHVFTICSDAHEKCPFFPSKKVTHVGFEDPPKLARGMKSDEDILNVYRKIRDEIKTFIVSIHQYL